MPPVLTDLAERNLAEGAATLRAARGAGVKIALGVAAQAHGGPGQATWPTPIPIR